MYTNRLKKFRQDLDLKNVDAGFITNPLHIYYLSGIQTASPMEREAYLLITHSKTYIISDSRYQIDIQAQIVKNNLQNECVFELITIDKRLTNWIELITKQEMVQVIGFEANNITHSEFSSLKMALPTISFVDIGNSLIELRTIKDSYEIEQLEKAGDSTDQCLTEVTPTFKVGMKEKQAAWLIEKWIREKGFELAFDVMVAFDESAAMPHYNAKHGDRVLRDNSIILIDFGIKYNHYLSDISRVFFMPNSAERLKDIYSQLLDVQQKTVNAVGSSVTTYQQLDAFCRDKMQENKLQQFAHAVGHGVGLEIHEKPAIGRFFPQPFQPGHCITIEPGIYVEGEFGMRIEDTIIITSELYSRCLTKFPKNIQVLKG